MGISCEVIAPSLAPAKPGDRVKTDRRDAERLASSYQAGVLTAVWVPDPKHEALRDLVRAREAAKEDVKRAKHRLGKYLLRYGQRPESGARSWTAVWWQWVRNLELPHAEQNTTLLELILEVDHQTQRVERLDGAIDRAVAAAPEHLRAIVSALQALRGVAQETAVTLAVEIGSFSRFERSYTGDGLHRPSRLGVHERDRSENRERSRRPATRTCVEPWWRRPGTTDTDRDSISARSNCRATCHPRSRPSRGRPRSGFTGATGR